MAKTVDAVAKATLVVGGDPDLVHVALVELISRIEDLVGSDLERLTFQGGYCTVEEVLVAWTQNFMFAPNALIVFRDPSCLTEEELETLFLAIDNYVGDNYLLLVNFTGKVIPRLRNYFSKAGSLIDSSLKSSKEKSTFLAQLVASSGLMFDPEAYRLLASHLGLDVGRGEAVLDLLKEALGERARVDSAALFKYLDVPGDVAPWDFTDAIEAGETGKALDMLWRLTRSGGRHPLVIISILQRRMVELAVISGVNVRTPRDALSVLRRRDPKFNRPEFVVKKMLAAAEALGYDGFSHVFSWLSQADRQIKGEGGLEPELAVELLVARLAANFNAANKRRSREFAS